MDLSPLSVCVPYRDGDGGLYGGGVVCRICPAGGALFGVPEDGGGKYLCFSMEGTSVFWPGGYVYAVYRIADGFFGGGADGSGCGSAGGGGHGEAENKGMRRACGNDGGFRGVVFSAGIYRPENPSGGVQ